MSEKISLDSSVLSEYLRAEHIEQNTTNNKYEHTRIRT